MESRRLRASRARALRLALPLLLAACVTPEREDPSLDQAVTPPERGPLVVDRTLRVAPGEYLRPPLGPAGEAGVIRIERRRGLVLDLTGVTLRGQPAGSSPDTARGYAVLLRGCRDVTLRGGTFSGYLGGIVLDDCRDVVIEGASIEEGYADRLRSSVVTADPADLLVPETRRPTGWLDRYGAAIAIVGCRGVTVRASRARSGQNGVLLLGSEDCTVTGNDFSFLSGWGVGLLDSRDNTVSGNRLDFCARGYYGDAYAEGFNAAGMLVAEGCSGNTLAWNSATRCGFGLLVVGDARADEDERVAGNLYYGNDLSYAVAHGALLIGDRDDWLVDGRIVGSLDAAVRLVDADGVVVRGNALEDVPSA